MNPIKLRCLIAVAFMFSLLSVSCVQDNSLKQDSENVHPAIQRSDEICGEVFTTPIIAGKHTTVGELIVSNTEDELSVTYSLDEGWKLSETHLYVGDCDQIPFNGGGNPKIGKFPYKKKHNPLIQEYPYTIPLSGLGECYCIVAHSVVHKSGENGNQRKSETAFAIGDEEFPGNRWGWYFQYCTQDCEFIPQ